MLTQYNKKIPKDAICIIDMIEKAGFEAYIVGGCVRDLLMNRIPHDWDITTSATPEEIKKIFRRTYDTGIKHGTVTVILNEEHYEVTTYRIEGEYKDFRRPTEVSFVDDITLDLSRRDFTMNAIAYHP
ncbi:MAG: polynucleotide adenylyltransferase, partial [Cellulosilyticum sp.]|nr:polynucleotide adenylyltransferase [Cellulosilyticum sp.]